MSTTQLPFPFFYIGLAVDRPSSVYRYAFMITRHKSQEENDSIVRFVAQEPRATSSTTAALFGLRYALSARMFGPELLHAHVNVLTKDVRFYELFRARTDYEYLVDTLAITEQEAVLLATVASAAHTQNLTIELDCWAYSYNPQSHWHAYYEPAHALLTANQ